MSYIVRPVKEEDLSALLDLSIHSPVGMDNLPREKETLLLLIKKSAELFKQPSVEPAKVMYIFVMEETSSKTVVGMCGIWAMTGVMHPLLFYKLEEMETAEVFLEMPDVMEILKLVKHEEGPSEICSLYLIPEHRHEGLGKLLSFSRFMFMAAFPERFTKEIVTVIQGVITESGKSPFWEAIGKHFLKLEFSELKKRMLEDSSFIPSILPKFPLYVDLLPEEAKSVLGTAHPASAPAFNLLMQEGFTFDGEIDVFDAGPRLTAPLVEIHAVRNSRVANASDADAEHKGLYLVSNERLDFRCCKTALAEMPDGSVSLPKETFEALQIAVGDPVRYLSIMKNMKPQMHADEHR